MFVHEGQVALSALMQFWRIYQNTQMPIKHTLDANTHVHKHAHTSAALACGRTYAHTHVHTLAHKQIHAHIHALCTST